MTDDDRDDGQQQAWANEYEAYCAEQDDEDEINRLLNEANDENV